MENLNSVMGYHLEAIAQGCSMSLVSYLEQYILPYYEHFDKGHGVDHALCVITGSLELATELGLQVDMALCIAAYHDIGLCDGREWHHRRSAELLLADSALLCWFTVEELQLMSEAIFDHRASNSHVPRSIYGKVVAESDRIIDCEVTLRRTVQYGLSHYPQLSIDAQYERFKNHLNEKYGANGYLTLWLELPRNVQGLEALRNLLADEPELRHRFDILYGIEMGR